MLVWYATASVLDVAKPVMLNKTVSVLLVELDAVTLSATDKVKAIEVPSAPLVNVAICVVVVVIWRAVVAVNPYRLDVTMLVLPSITLLDSVVSLVDCVRA